VFVRCGYEQSSDCGGDGLLHMLVGYSPLGFLFLRSVFGGYDGVEFELERWSVH
jgi:hypothetical protein